MKKDWDHSGVSTGTRQKQEAAKVRNGVSVGQLRALKESPNVVGDKPVTEVIDDGIAVIAGITDDMFELITVGKGEDAYPVSVIKKDYYLPVSKFMGALIDTDLRILIFNMLASPASNKDIQLLSKFNIKNAFLGKFYNACCLKGSYVYDEEVLNITLFMLRNNFFTIEEIEANLSLSEPIPFFKPGIVVDGLSVEKRSMIANMPDEIRKLPMEKIEEKKAYCQARFVKLIEAVKEDFNKRLETQKAKEEDEARDRTRGYDYYKR